MQACGITSLSWTRAIISADHFARSRYSRPALAYMDFVYYVCVSKQVAERGFNGRGMWMVWGHCVLNSRRVMLDGGISEKVR